MQYSEKEKKKRSYVFRFGILQKMSRINLYWHTPYSLSLSLSTRTYDAHTQSKRAKNEKTVESTNIKLGCKSIIRVINY